MSYLNIILQIIPHYNILNPSFPTENKSQNSHPGTQNVSENDSDNDSIDDSKMEYVDLEHPQGITQFSPPTDPNAKYPLIPSIKSHIKKIQNPNNKSLKNQSINTLECNMIKKYLQLQNELLKINETIPLDIQDIQHLLFNIPDTYDHLYVAHVFINSPISLALFPRHFDSQIV